MGLLMGDVMNIDCLGAMYSMEYERFSGATTWPAQE
jgi:hypothetical protein